MRTDIHRPSAINPDDYDYVACDYYGPWAVESMAEERKRFRLHMERTGGKFAEKHNSGSCHVCGAAAMYVAKYHHRPSNTYIVTGEDCAFKMDSGDGFKKMRAAVAHERKIMKGKAVAREILALLGLSDAWRVYEAPYVEGAREEDIIRSIVAKLVQYGNISQKQADFIRKLLNDIVERPAKQEARAAAAAVSQFVGAIGERRDFELEVVGTYSFEGSFGTVYGHIMVDASGNKVVYKGNKIADKGERVILKATVAKHDEYKGEKQTVVSRPKVSAPSAP